MGVSRQERWSGCTAYIALFHTRACIHVSELSSVGCAERVDQGSNSNPPEAPRAQVALDAEPVKQLTPLSGTHFLEICSLIFLICWVEHTLLL